MIPPTILNSEIVELIQKIGIPLLTFFLGNKFVIGRERRKDFNLHSEAAYIGLMRQAEDLKRGHFRHAFYEYHLVEPLIPFWKRRGFRKAVERHHANHHDVSSYDVNFGTAQFDQDKIKQLIVSNRNLLKYLKRR